MTNLVCPLCGRRVNMAGFDPTSYDLDIYAVEVAGLGRGKGFKETSITSILQPGDVTVELIKDRILVLSKLLIDEGCIDTTEVLSALNIKTVNPKEIEVRDRVINDSSSKIASLKDQVVNLEEDLKIKDSLIKDMSTANITLESQDTITAIELKDKDRRIKDLLDDTSWLKREIQALKERNLDIDKVSEDLTEAKISLKAELEELKNKVKHRTEQAKKLREFVRQRGRKIDYLEQQVSDLTEKLID